MNKQVKFNIPLERCPILECPECGTTLFLSFHQFRKVPTLLLPSGTPDILIEQILICSGCKKNYANPGQLKNPTKDNNKKKVVSLDDIRNN